MIIVLDASAGIEVALDREKAKAFEGHLLKASKIITSDLYKAETANVLWKYVKANLLPKEDALRIYGNCENIIDEFVDISENVEEAISESIRLNHSTYDLLYFSLARRHGAILITVDKKLTALAEKNGVEIIR